MSLVEVDESCSLAGQVKLFIGFIEWLIVEVRTVVAFGGLFTQTLYLLLAVLILHP